MKQARVLRDERDGSSQALLRDFTNVLVIDADGPFDHIVHAQQQAHEGGLAGAARSHEADALPCRDGQLKGFDDIASMPGLVFGGRVVRKRNALEMNGAPRHRQLGRTGPVHDRRGHDQRLDALAGRAQLVIELGDSLPDVVRRLQKGARECGDHHEIARADQAVHPGIEGATDED